MWHAIQPASSNRAAPRRTWGILRGAHSGRRQRPPVENDLGDPLRKDLRDASCRVPVVGLIRRAVLGLKKRRGDSDVAMESAGDVLLQGGDVGLPAKPTISADTMRTSQTMLALSERPSPSSSSGLATESMSASGIASSRPVPNTDGAIRRRASTRDRCAQTPVRPKNIPVAAACTECRPLIPRAISGNSSGTGLWVERSVLPGPAVARRARVGYRAAGLGATPGKLSQNGRPLSGSS